jgi:acetyltransferase-like isoleucine patch superfamily enzyme
VRWLKPVTIPVEAGRAFNRFAGELAERLDDPGTDRNELVRDLLAQVHFGRRYCELPKDDHAPIGIKMALLNLDPRNVTFEAEHYNACEPEKFAAVKPLLWLWKSLDQTPIGLNPDLGVPVRRVLAERIFKRCGKNFKAWQNVEFSVGYNLEVGDDVVMHRHVFVDDIGGVEIRDGASLSDFVNVYSHTHDIHDPRHVILRKTVIGRGARLTYHSTVLAGTFVSDDAMLGTYALATRDVPPHAVSLGIPAKPRVYKERGSGWGELEVDSERDPHPPERLGSDPDE